MRICFATLNLEVADPQTSKRFYIDAIGMRENIERSEPPGFVYLQSDGAAVTLASREDESKPAPPSPSMEIGFEVDDLAAVRHRLNEWKLNGFSTQTMGWGEVIEGHDVDGHRIIIYELRKGAI